MLKWKVGVWGRSGALGCSFDMASMVCPHFFYEGIDKKMNVHSDNCSVSCTSGGLLAMICWLPFCQILTLICMICISTIVVPCTAMPCVVLTGKLTFRKL